MKKIPKKNLIFSMIITVFLLFFICLITPYFQVNHLTKKYRTEFEELYSENGFYQDIEYLKIFQYRDEKVPISYLDNGKLMQELNDLNGDYAVVLYVEENHSSASVYIFSGENGQWELLNWHLIWSASGTADGFMWPYYF